MSGIYKPMELDIWSPDWYLPSVDTDCLFILAYAQFSNVKLQINVTNNPFRSPSGTLPILHHYKKNITDHNEIVEYFKSKGHDADGALSAQEKSEIVAYETMLREKLYPAMQYLFWVDDMNRLEVIRPWYWKHMPFPLYFYYPGRYETKARELVAVLHPDVEEIKVKEIYILAEAESCISLLSNRLSKTKGPYCFGKSPSSLDALLFAYLAPLLKCPLKNKSLQNHLNSCTNLNKFITFICQTHFKKQYIEYEQKKKKMEKETEDKQKNKESDFPHSVRNTIFAALFATLAMTGYAISIGLINTSIRTK